jgi:ribonuclease BN (tRNA processing enzyme)
MGRRERNEGGGFTAAWIGTGTGIPRLDRRGPSTLVEAAGSRIAVDLGLGSLHGLLLQGVRHAELDAVLVTHLHPDHTCELAAFFFAANYDEEPRRRRLLLVGGAGFGAFLEALQRAFHPWLEPKHYELEVKELSPGSALGFGALRCSAGPASHIASSLAYRFECGGSSLVLSGDTGPCPALEGFARNVDVLALEASLPSGESTAQHLNAAQAGSLARAAGARLLVLNHLYPAADRAEPEASARASFGGEVLVASDGLKLAISC